MDFTFISFDDKIFVQLRNTFKDGGSKSRAVLLYYLYMSKFV